MFLYIGQIASVYKNRVITPGLLASADDSGIVVYEKWAIKILVQYFQ